MNTEQKCCQLCHGFIASQFKDREVSVTPYCKDAACPCHQTEQTCCEKCRYLWSKDPSSTPASRPEDITMHCGNPICPCHHTKQKCCKTPCIPFKGTISTKGYGVLTLRGRQWKAHILAVLLDGRRYPKGYVTDHLCRNRKCINPAHLAIVKSGDNVLVGESQPAKNAAKTHCSKGHPLTGDNLRLRKASNTKSGRAEHWRVCRTCWKVYDRKFKQKQNYGKQR